ncbi:hypothetical protein NFJ02_14g16550 [Pycnococcus provasolii]
MSSRAHHHHHQHSGVQQSDTAAFPLPFSFSSGEWDSGVSSQGQDNGGHKSGRSTQPCSEDDDEMQGGGHTVIRDFSGRRARKAPRRSSAEKGMARWRRAQEEAERSAQTEPGRPGSRGTARSARRERDRQQAATVTLSPPRLPWNRRSGDRASDGAGSGPVSPPRQSRQTAPAPSATYEYDAKPYRSGDGGGAQLYAHGIDDVNRPESPRSNNSSPDRGAFNFRLPSHEVQARISHEALQDESLGFQGAFGRGSRNASMTDSLGAASLPYDALADASIMSDVVGEQYASGYTAGYASGFAAGYASGVEEGAARARNNLRAADAAGLLGPSRGTIRNNKIAISDGTSLDTMSETTVTTVTGVEDSDTSKFQPFPQHNGSPISPMRSAVPIRAAKSPEDMQATSSMRGPAMGESRTPTRTKSRDLADGAVSEVGTVLGSVVDVAVTLGIVAAVRPVLGLIGGALGRRRRPSPMLTETSRRTNPRRRSSKAIDESAKRGGGGNFWESLVKSG